MVEEILFRITLEEKVGQLNQLETPKMDKLEKFKEKVRNGQVGSVLMSVGATAGNTTQGEIDVDFYNELQCIAAEESPSGIPVLFGRDVIHGHRTVFPIPLAALFLCFYARIDNPKQFFASGYRIMYNREEKDCRNQTIIKVFLLIHHCLNNIPRNHSLLWFYVKFIIPIFKFSIIYYPYEPPKQKCFGGILRHW